KFNSAGSLVWAHRAGGAGADAVRAITIDKPGNIYTTGQFSGTADFDPGAGSLNLIGTPNLANTFVWNLNTSGNINYARMFKTASGFSEGTGIALNATGQVFVGGRFAGTVDLNPGSKVANRATGNDTS